jgi:hypothetical protein
MDLSDDLDDRPEPFHRRRSTKVLVFVVCAAIAIAGALWNAGDTSRTVRDLAARHQYDSAWSRLVATGGGLATCERLKLYAHLGRLDARSDSTLVRTADSLRRCRVPTIEILELAALGNARILAHATELDSSRQWMLQANAFRAASDCIKADSAHRACQLLGLQALHAMQDTFAQRVWLENALKHLPTDTALLSRKARLP